MSAHEGHARTLAGAYNRRLHHRRWGAAMKGSGLAGRVLGSRFDHFGTLPWPASKWTNARDVQMLPTESFRDWWARERGDGDQPAGDPADRGRDPSTDAHRASDQRAHGSTEQPEGEQR